jgi:hypothetical protein
MKNHNVKCKVAILIILTVLFSNVTYLPTKADSSQVIIFNEDNPYYENLTLESIYKEGMYYAVGIMKYSDSMYNHVVLTSTDGKKWNNQVDLSEKTEKVPDSISIRLLNNKFVVSTSHRNGNVRYISNDAREWIKVQLQYADLLFYSEQYWSIDTKGTIFNSKDLINWNQFAVLESSSKSELIALNLCVNDKVIVVSHYSPKWGSANYKNGLEVYDREQKIWKETIGYKGVYGTAIDIVYTGQKFILAYQNDYSYDAPIVYYTTKDGIHWSTDSHTTEILREFNLLLSKDSNILELVTVTKLQIEKSVLKGENPQVQVVLDGNIIQFDQEALLVEGRVLVPVRKIFESLGGTVEFNQETKELVGNIGDKSIKLTLGEKTATLNGEVIALDVPAQIINDRVLVPVRFIAECIGKKINWDQNNYVVSLDKLN